MCLIISELLWSSAALAGEPRAQFRADRLHIQGKAYRRDTHRGKNFTLTHLNKPRILGIVRQPWWQVGMVHRELTELCKLGHFRERYQRLRGLVFIEESSASETLGVAWRGFNLLDSYNRSQHDVVYYFKDSGTSGCKVLVWSSIWQSDPPTVEKVFAEFNAGRVAVYERIFSDEQLHSRDERSR